MLTVSSIAHVAIRVKDIDRTLAFYIDKLGFSELMRLDRDGRLWLVYLRITDDQYLEISPRQRARTFRVRKRWATTTCASQCRISSRRYASWSRRASL